MTTTLSHRAVAPAAAAWRRDDRWGALLAVMMAALIVLMIVPEGLDYESLVHAAAPDAAGWASRGLWLASLGTGLLVLAWRTRLAWLLLRSANAWLFLFVALALASLAWSIDPALSARRLLRLVTIVVACTGFVLMAWHARRFQNVVRPVLTGVLLGSLLFGLAWPALAIHQQASAELAGAWRGLANHKNSLGALASLGLIFWCHAALAREVPLRSALAGGAVAAACLLLSRSSTSLAATGIVLVFLAVAMRAPRGLRPFVPHLVVAMAALLLLDALATLGLLPGLAAFTETVSSITGKDATLTGRTAIWSILGDHMRLHPFLGTGYAAYWTAVPTAGTDAYEFVRRLGSFFPGSAHNGYFDVANDLGWAGLACLFAYAIRQVRQSLQLLACERPQGLLYLAVFFQQAITNLSETHWFSVQSVDFVVMTLTTTALARSLLEQRLRAAFGEP